MMPAYRKTGVIS